MAPVTRTDPYAWAQRLRDIPDEVRAFVHAFSELRGGAASAASSSGACCPPASWLPILLFTSLWVQTIAWLLVFFSPLQDALAELSMLGYTDSMGRRSSGAGAGASTGSAGWLAGLAGRPALRWQQRCCLHLAPPLPPPQPLVTRSLDCCAAAAADGSKFSFANGTGASSKSKKPQQRRNGSVGRAVKSKSPARR